jgi:hypothetical protein
MSQYGQKPVQYMLTVFSTYFSTGKLACCQALMPPART